MNIQTLPTQQRPSTPCNVSYLHEGKDFTFRLDLRSMSDSKRLQNIIYWAMNNGIEVYITPNQ